MSRRLRPPPFTRASVVATLLLAAITACLPFLPGWERMELMTQDARFTRRGPRPPQKTKIVLAVITPETTSRWKDLPLVFWRERIGQAIAQAHRAGAAWIALDIIPTADADVYLENVRATVNRFPDAALEQAIEEAQGRVCLTYILSPPVLPIPRFQSLDILQGRFGFADLPLAADGVVRQGWTTYPGHPDRISMGALLASLLEKQPPSVAAPPVANPFYLDVTGVPFPQIPLDQLAAGTLTADQRNLLRDAVVLIGTNDKLFDDFVFVPGVRRKVPGVEAIATTLVTLREGRMLHRLSPAQEGLLAAFCVVLCALLGIPLRFGPSLLVTLGGAGAYLIVAQAAFSTQNWLLPVVAPVLGMIMAWLVEQARRVLAETAARRRVEAIFGRHVSPAIRDHLLRETQQGLLEAKAVEATVLFFDIRGSTSYAETVDPETFLRELNDYLSAVTPVIEASGGLINRFLGDGFLALFGVPVAHPTPERAALTAARRIAEVTAVVNEARQANGRPPWRFGCGIHRGLVVAGSIGGANRAEYTVVGDTVNVAARLESATKELDSPVVVSEAVYECLSASDTADLYGLTTIPVRGRSGTLRVYRIELTHEIASATQKAV